MSIVAENRIALFEDVEELMEKSKKHFSELSKAENPQQIAESKLDDVIREIDRDQEDFRAVRVE